MNKQTPYDFETHLEAVKAGACKLVMNPRTAQKHRKKGREVIWSNELDGWLWWADR